MAIPVKASLAVLCAVLFATVAAPASLAEASEFKVSSYPATIEGDEVLQHTIGSESGIVDCLGADFTGTLVESSRTLSLTPSYSNCEFIGLTAEVNLNGCGYRLNVDWEPEAESGTMDIVCPPEKEIVISASGICTLRFPPQSNRATVFYQNMAGGYLRATLLVLFLKGSQAGLICPENTFTDAYYEGLIEFSAWNEFQRIPFGVG